MRVEIKLGGVIFREPFNYLGGIDKYNGVHDKSAFRYKGPLDNVHILPAYVDEYLKHHEETVFSEQDIGAVGAERDES